MIVVCISIIMKGITTWEDLKVYLSHTFSFVDDDLVIHNALQHIHDVVLEIILVAFPTESHEIPVM